MYRITKVLNHNAVLALHLQDGHEDLVVGKGAGFGRKPGERVEFSPDVTVYVLAEKCDRGNPRELVKRIDPIYLNIATGIVLAAKEPRQHRHQHPHSSGRPHRLCRPADLQKQPHEQSPHPRYQGPLPPGI